MLEGFSPVEERRFGDLYSFEKHLLIGFPQGQLVLQLPLWRGS